MIFRQNHVTVFWHQLDQRIREKIDHSMVYSIFYLVIRVCQRNILTKNLLTNFITFINKIYEIAE